MTREQRLYIQAAVKALDGDLTASARIKILRTMSQILAQSADSIEQKLVDSIEQKLYTQD